MSDNFVRIFGESGMGDWVLGESILFPLMSGCECG